MLKLEPYATHLPLLVACVAHTHGPVLELGCGLYSTPVLHALCLDRPLVSLESDEKWLDQFQGYATRTHRLGLFSDDLPLSFAGQRWSVVFVDQAPAPARAESIRRLKGHADLIVCHDSEHRLYDYESVLGDFNQRVEWQRYAPWTTVVSNTLDLGFLKTLL